MSYKELLVGKGFAMYKRCRACTGQLEEKFRPVTPDENTRGFDIVIRPERMTFLIRKDGARRSQGALETLEEALKLNQL